VREKKEVKIYSEFLKFVAQDIQIERGILKRRMFSVFLWCFVLPALSYLFVVLSIRLGWLSLRWLFVSDWLLLGFPLVYSLYFLGSEVLWGMRLVVKQGGVNATLKDLEQDTYWRVDTSEKMSIQITAEKDLWKTIYFNFKKDLERMRYRSKYLTVFSAAIFFLIMKGIDVLEPESPVNTQWNAQSFLLWIDQMGGSLNQVVAVFFFLVLLFLSSSEMIHRLEKYLDCAELNSKK
tara:strand:+ start:961 stop:1665 length:705 start_codon:yes stop_codon:yes gene_type:complete